MRLPSYGHIERVLPRGLNLVLWIRGLWVRRVVFLIQRALRETFYRGPFSVAFCLLWDHCGNLAFFLVEDIFGIFSGKTSLNSINISCMSYSWFSLVPSCIVSSDWALHRITARRGYFRSWYFDGIDGYMAMVLWVLGGDSVFSALMREAHLIFIRFNYRHIFCGSYLPEMRSSCWGLAAKRIFWE